MKESKADQRGEHLASYLRKQQHYEKRGKKNRSLLVGNAESKKKRKKKDFCEES